MTFEAVLFYLFAAVLLGAALGVVAGFQVQGIKSIPEVPVHPGLVKYLKEKGLWDSSWKIASEDTIKAAIAEMKAKAK